MKRKSTREFDWTSKSSRRTIAPDVSEVIESNDQEAERQEQEEEDIRREMEEERIQREQREQGTASSKKKKKKKKKKPKYSLKRSKKRMISKKQYKELIKKRQHHKKLTPSQRKKLDHTLFINYCSCVKSLKYDKKVKDYLEYPVCMSSVYKKRGFEVPKGVTARCSKYKH